MASRNDNIAALAAAMNTVEETIERSGANNIDFSAPYIIGVIRFEFLPNDTISISNNITGASITGYFPWSTQKDRGTVAWEIFSILEDVTKVSLATFKRQWDQIIPSRVLEKIWKSGSTLLDSLKSINIDSEAIANARRLSAACMTEHVDPYEFAKRQIKENMGLVKQFS